MRVIKPVTVEDSRDFVIDSPGDIVDILRDFYRDLCETEFFSVISINMAHKIIEMRVIAQGTINQTVTHPREVFRHAVMDNAAALFLCHNHPSGDSRPSEEDLKTTERLLKASKIIGIEILDHIILGGDDYYSMLQHGVGGFYD